MKRFQKYCEC